MQLATVTSTGDPFSTPLEVSSAASGVLVAFAVSRPGSTITVTWVENTGAATRADESMAEIARNDLGLGPLGPGTSGNAACARLSAWLLTDPTPTNDVNHSRLLVTNSASDAVAVVVYHLSGVHQTESIVAVNRSHWLGGTHHVACGDNALILEAAGWMTDNSDQATPAVSTDPNYPPASRTQRAALNVDRSFGQEDAALGSSSAVPTASATGNNHLPWNFMSNHQWVGIALALQGA